MLRISYRRIKPDKLDRLRSWMQELMERRDEVHETFDHEGVRSERAWVIHDEQGPILVYAIEADDLEKARQAYRNSTLPIDLEHREVLREVLGERLEPELLYDLSAPS